MSGWLLLLIALAVIGVALRVRSRATGAGRDPLPPVGPLRDAKSLRRYSSRGGM